MGRIVITIAVAVKIEISRDIDATMTILEFRHRFWLQS
jgi:hypothetical protein